MNQQLSPETQYFFDLSDQQWWVLPKADDVWKEMSNEEAYKLGLFKAVFSQKCNFIDTNLSQYDEAVSNLIRELDEKFSLNQEKPKSSVLDKVDQAVSKVLTKDFSNENEDQLKTNKSEQFVKFKESRDFQTNLGSNPFRESKELSTELSRNKLEMEKTYDTTSNTNKVNTTTTTTNDNNNNKYDGFVEKEEKDKGSENLLSQINNLIASTSQMKQMCKAKELSAQNKGNSPTVRSTARHLTYVNNGGLAGCLKTVAEERKKVGSSKKMVKQPQSSQLQEMIQRAKVMAAKTMDEVKEPEQTPTVKKAPQAKKTQLRSNAKRYTTVFGAAALKDLRLNQQLPDVTFEGSSDDDSEDEKRNKKK